MPVQLGINPLTWTNDDLPSLGGDTPLEVCLSEGKQAGFAGFELGHKFPREADALNTVLAAHDLKAVQHPLSIPAHPLSAPNLLPLSTMSTSE